MALSTNILMQSMFEQKIKRTRLQNVKEYLLNALQIHPHHQSLVMVLGTGNEQNNSDALCYWLKNQAKLDQTFSTLSLGDIEYRLMRHLEGRLDRWPN